MYTFIISLIIIRTLSDISFKKAVHKRAIEIDKHFLLTWLKLHINPFYVMGIFFGIGNMLLWVQSMTVFDLSFAYPFLTISYVTIIISGAILFKEHIDKYKVAGILLIITGGAFLFLST